jgi:hypothetical protein
MGSDPEVFLVCPTLRPESGRAGLDGLKLFAFLRLEVHHNSLSSGIEPLELLEHTEAAAEEVERSFSFSLAILSFRSPTFSVSGSVQDKSAENILDGDREAQLGGRTNYTKSQRTTGKDRARYGYHTN